jgi:hypothetical protein
MLSITCEEEAGERSREELIITSAVVMTSGHEEVGCSCDILSTYSFLFLFF